jgi:hypothetical protein
VNGFGRNAICRHALHEGISRIARDEQDLEFPIAAADRLKKSGAIHFWHHHIGNDEVDRAVLLLQRSRRRKPMMRRSA